MNTTTKTPAYRCSDCGWTSVKWVGRCGECQAWGTVDEIITIHNAVQHNLGADPLHVYVLEGKVHTVQVTRITTTPFNEEWDIEVSTPQYGSTGTFEHVATVQGKRALWLIVQVFLNEEVDI